MNVTKGPGDLPPYEPEESFWDDSEWADEQMTALREEWVDKAQEILLDYIYGQLDRCQLDEAVYKLVSPLIEKIEERAEASRYPPH